MADSETGYKWWLRYIVVPLVGGGGLIALLVALISRPEPTTTEPPKTPVMQQNISSPDTVVQRRPTVEVEKLVARWFGAWINGNEEDVVSLVSEPFYFDQEVVLTRPEVRAVYQQLRREKGYLWQKAEIQSIKVQTARELQGTGFDLSKDRVFGSLNLTLDDYAVIVKAKFDGESEGVLIAVRREGDRYEIVGMWS